VKRVVVVAAGRGGSVPTLRGLLAEHRGLQL
jgi:hypothetical protein